VYTGPIGDKRGSHLASLTNLIPEDDSVLKGDPRAKPFKRVRDDGHRWALIDIVCGQVVADGLRGLIELSESKDREVTKREQVVPAETLFGYSKNTVDRIESDGGEAVSAPE
jgi:hypothetical protein